jgi:hypothetical protein
MSAPQLFQTTNHRAPIASQPSRPNQEPMPEWLVRRFTESGHIDADSGATRRARMSRCRRCHRPVVLGFDSDPSRPHAGYMSRQVDPQPLSPTGEALALLSGRITFNLGWHADHWEINGPRDRWQIAGKRTGIRDVVVEHDCALSITPLPGQPSNVPNPYRTTALPEEAPF